MTSHVSQEPLPPERDIKLTRATELKAMLARRGIHPSRTLGQNFLVDENLLKILLDASGVSAGDLVLEIGAGPGALTTGLLDRGCRVLAVEKDHRLAAWLREHLAGRPDVELIEGDALDMNLDALLARGVHNVVSNLPYSVGTRILVELVRAAHAPARLLVTVQNEVADRITARPGTKDYGLLSIWMQLDYDAKVVRTLRGSCFFPAPDVTSALVRLVRRDKPRGQVRNPTRFAALTCRAFAARRKQIRRILLDLPPELGRPAELPDAWFEGLKLDPMARPGDLSIETWVAIANALEDLVTPAGRRPTAAARPRKTE